MEYIKDIKQKVKRLDSQDEDLHIAAIFQGLSIDHDCKDIALIYGESKYPVILYALTAKQALKNRRYTDEFIHDQIKRFNYLMDMLNANRSTPFDLLEEKYFLADYFKENEASIFAMDLGKFLANMTSQERGVYIASLYALMLYMNNCFVGDKYDYIKQAYDHMDFCNYPPHFNSLPKNHNMNKYIGDHEKDIYSMDKEELKSCLIKSYKGCHLNILEKVFITIFFILFVISTSLFIYMCFAKYSQTGVIMPVLNQDLELIMIRKGDINIFIYGFGLTSYEDIVNTLFISFASVSGGVSLAIVLILIFFIRHMLKSRQQYACYYYYWKHRFNLDKS